MCCNEAVFPPFWLRSNVVTFFKFVGGIVHFRCPHQVAIYFKYVLRQESARDYIDAVLSLRKQPNVIISDIASQVLCIVINIAFLFNCFIQYNFIPCAIN